MGGGDRTDQLLEPLEVQQTGILSYTAVSPQ